MKNEGRNTTSSLLCRGGKTEEMVSSTDPPEIGALHQDLLRTVGSPEGKARLAVLEAVRQAVKDRSLPNTMASYAAALLNAAQTSSESGTEEEGEEMIAAVIYLLGHVLSSLTDKLLRGKFADMSSAVAAAMERHPASAAIARHGLQCLFVLLKAQVMTPSSARSRLARYTARQA